MNAENTPQPQWIKSSYSTAQGGDCVETAELSAAMGVRDSKDTARGHLTVTSAAWATFLGALKR